MTASNGDNAMAGNDQGASQGVVGKVCPKCGYARKADEPVPETRCPKCRVLYAKAEEERTSAAKPQPTVKPSGGSKLIPCSDCGHEVSPKAESCPKCGAPLKQPAAAVTPPQDMLSATEAVLKGIVGLIVLIGIFSVFFGGDDSEESETATVAVEQRVLTPAEMREERIKDQFSAWDGSHRNLEKHVKQFLNDPDSFEHDKTGYVDNGDHLVVTMIYRAKNGFGATVLGAVKAKVSLDGDILEVLESY